MSAPKPPSAAAREWRAAGLPVPGEAAVAPPRASRSATPRPSERLSHKTLERLRSTFLSTASAGSVFDTYTVGPTIGASPASLVVEAERPLFWMATRSELLVSRARV